MRLEGIHVNPAEIHNWGTRWMAGCTPDRCCSGCCSSADCRSTPVARGWWGLRSRESSTSSTEPPGLRQPGWERLARRRPRPRHRIRWSLKRWNHSRQRLMMPRSVYLPLTTHSNTSWLSPTMFGELCWKANVSFSRSQKASTCWRTACS